MSITTDWEISGYEVGQRIASGGMSDVFLAVRLADSRQVVVKTSRSASDEQTRRRLVREHRLLQAIDHPNVAQVLDSGCTDDRPYLVLEYIQGGSLRELLRPGKPLAWHQFSPILRQLSDALSALHAKNILHRDVKPENVLVDERGQVKLIDLSIGTETREVGALTGQNQLLGTVDYMAPEQRHRIGIDQRTDQYSLAAVTFEMLTGRCSLGQFRRPSELNPDLPESLDQAVLKGLERDPDDRFSSVESFAKAVLSAAEAPRHRRRLPWVAACAISLIGIAASGFLLPRSTEPDAVGAGSVTPIARSADDAARSAVDAGRSAVDADLPSMTNTLGMRLVRLPAGSFQMGTSIDELHRHFPTHVPAHMMAEIPKHSVTLSRPFWMGVHEVSVAQFRAFVEESGHQTTGEIWLADHERLPMQPVWDDPARYPAYDDLPVCAVSWDDAVQFCRWLSDREGVTYRLPTEAEWEYACRAGSTGPWFCKEGELAAYAVLARPWHAGPQSIGERLANPWGLHDMHGNVWEWCQDLYSETYYEDAPTTDPVCSQTDEQGYHVIRGGAYKAAPKALRSTMRRGQDNSGAHSDLGHGLGFRVVCDAPRPQVARRSQ